ncbi:hypothetical protein ACWC3X_20525 [Streptomyces populi]
MADRPAARERHTAKCEGPWWNLGDMAVVGRWGAVRPIDREIDRIPGASALEIEDVLLDRLPQITEVVVLAVRGALPQPVLSLREGTSLEPERWRRATADPPPMAAPLRIRWEEFPRTATWKIRRTLLREQLLAGAAGVGSGRWT